LGLLTKFFYNIRPLFVVLTTVTSVSIVVVIFSANSVCKHSYTRLLSARINLIFLLRRWQWWENEHIASKRLLTWFLACSKKLRSWLCISV